jgi:glycosyltransferase involved in cell wall biosynthesis
MKLLIIGQLPPPVHGSNVMTQLFMHSLQKLGHDVDIVEKTFSLKQEDVGAVSIAKIMRAPHIVFKLFSHLIQNRPDICYYFISVGKISFAFDALLTLILRLFGVDYVLYSHGKGLKELETMSGTVFRYVIKQTLSGALGGLVLGESLKKDINNFVPNERLFILPNAIPDIKWNKNGPVRKNSHPVQILFLSNLIPSKGPLEFIKMAGIVYRKFKNVRFVLAGRSMGDAFLQEIRASIEQSGVRDVVTVPGPVYGTDKEKLFQETDIFVFPTYYDRETFGLVNLEAMQCGLPVISTSEGAIPEVVVDSINGFIIDPHNIDQMAGRVQMLVEDEELRRAMGKAGRERYEQYYTIEAYEKRLAESICFFQEIRQ